MYIQAQTITGYKKELWYSIPSTWDAHSIGIGTIIRVPLRNTTVPAIVTHCFQEKPLHVSFTIKEATAIEPFPDDTLYQKFITNVSDYYQISVVHIIARIRKFITQKNRTVQKENFNATKITKTISLTEEQKKVCAYGVPYIENQKYAPVLLHGVTGSGKTECYKELIKKAIATNKTVFLLLPEVSLAIAFEQRLQQELPNIEIFGFHSHTSEKNKKIMWDVLCSQKPVLIIGVHLPILLPVANLGLIIIDEEHEIGYQEKKHPKINSRDIAIMRAQQYNIPIILGSATPSVTSLYNVKQKGWKLFTLTNRFQATFPKITPVSLLEKKSREFFWITKNLQQAIALRIAKKEQTIIFINRRGVSFFVQCKECSFIFSCSNCSVSLTLHENNILTCHYCNKTMQLGTNCPECKVEDDPFLKKGIGTQQVVTILQKLFPSATVARADMDTSSQKKTWKETIKKMHSGEIDILVGTQTITKGLDFANVTLVGIIWADLNLHIPVYNATEKTIQQLIQVAGRAGRGGKQSEVIVQTIGNYPVLSFITEEKYNTFCAQELETRQLIGYPPFTRLISIEIRNSSEKILHKETDLIFYFLKQLIKTYGFEITLLGPSKPPVHKIKNVYTLCMYAKGNNMEQLILLFKAVTQKNYKSKLFFTPNPLGF